MKILIVGGVAGGATAAARMRRLDEQAEIVIIERGKHISFANCGLPYHIGGVIPLRESLLLNTPESFEQNQNVTVRTRTEAIKINRTDKQLVLKDLDTNREYVEDYDKLLLSPGAMPFKPSIDGINDDGVFTLRNVEDMDRILSWIQEKKVRSATVIGGGFIGLEMIENMKHRGLEVNLVELADQVLLNIDKDMANNLHQELIQNDVHLFLKDAVKAFKSTGDMVEVTLTGGTRFETGVVIFSAGIRPEIKLAKEAGLELGVKGIRVNAFLETSDPDIYAVGDAVEINHYILKKPVNIPLAGPANRQGRIVAGNILGQGRERYEGAIGTSITKVFNKTVACTGLNSDQLSKAGFDFLESFTVSKSHAGYYPGATPMVIKLLFLKTGEIVGTQICGEKGVDKRIDVFATAIKSGLKVQDLEWLELSYAPPFGSAKDPVNIAGYVAHNIIKGDMEIIGWKEMLNASQDVTILDVRNPKELEDCESIKPERMINIPLPILRNNLDKLDKEKTIYVYCQIGARGYFAYRILKQNGFKCKNLSGGFMVYNRAVKKY
jgi:NADPH-dependent 2,4-dienoyl-CoA reductase/sulfur reductase-like enzyme/rhodanese-related sulfurtransferase